MIEWNKLGFVICERSLYMQIFNLDRSYLLLSFNLITLSSLAIPSKSFLFTPFSFYEGIQDLDSMARNIQYFHPEPETTVSCRSWAPQSSSPSLARWLFLGTSLPPTVAALLSLLPVRCSDPGKLLLPIPLLSLSLTFVFCVSQSSFSLAGSTLLPISPFEVTPHETFKNQTVILHNKSIEKVKTKIISCQMKPLGPKRDLR